MSELSTEARAILEAGRLAMVPTEAVRVRVRSAVEARVAGSVAGASAAGIGVKLVLLSCLAIGLLGALAIAWRSGRAGQEPRHDSAAVVASPSVRTPVATPEPVVTEMPPDPPAPAKVRTRPHPAAPGPGLAEELALLGKARAALRSARPADAIAVLDRHRREIRSPQLEREALVLRAEALCAEGDHEAGRQALDLIASRWPGAAGLDAVRGRCGL